jgi:hypothetical protein
MLDIDFSGLSPFHFHPADDLVGENFLENNEHFVVRFDPSAQLDKIANIYLPDDDIYYVNLENAGSGSNIDYSYSRMGSHVMNFEGIVEHLDFADSSQDLKLQMMHFHDGQIDMVQEISVGYKYRNDKYKVVENGSGFEFKKVN